MRVFSRTDLDRMQGAQEAAMMDRCVILHYVETDRVDAYGTPVAPFVEGPVIYCGFEANPRDGVNRDEFNAPAGGGNETQAEGSNVKFRFPIDTAVGNLDRVMVLERFGELVTDAPLIYELLEAPRSGPSGLTARARRVM